MAASMYTRNPGMGGGVFRDIQWNQVPPPPQTDHRATAVRRLVELQDYREFKRGRIPLTWVQVSPPPGSGPLSASIPNPSGDGSMWCAPTVNFASHGFKLVSSRVWNSYDEILETYLARDIEEGALPVGYVTMKHPYAVAANYGSDGPFVNLPGGEILVPAGTAKRFHPHGFRVVRDDVASAIAAIGYAAKDEQIAERIAWQVEAVRHHRTVLGL